MQDICRTSHVTTKQLHWLMRKAQSFRMLVFYEKFHNLNCQRNSLFWCLTCRLTYKLWAQSLSPPWGLWWCGKHHSWQEQHSHTVVCTAREVGLSLSRSTAYDLEIRNNNASENPVIKHAEDVFCTLYFIYQFLRHVQQCIGLSSSLYCSGPKEKWHERG